ncbi:MAG: hypothetical protein ISEC1_P0517 [Thiomicrorhabdus sp.]|nr:MAG: hypothetical protein ISEC1_P0517 [Thiomicrorhabdus sp.]
MYKIKRVQVWDIWIRIFHWALVCFFVLAYITGKNLDIIHSYAGYAIMALLTFRIVWGFIGSTYARFTNFIYSPLTTHEYTISLMRGEPKHYYGHNPLAALLIFVMIFALIATSFTGLKTQGLKGEGLLASNDTELVSRIKASKEKQAHQIYYNYLEKEEKHYWQAAHMYAANFTLFLIFVHLIGVIISSTVHRENIMQSMVDGQKEPPIDYDKN